MMKLKGIVAGLAAILMVQFVFAGEAKKFTEGTPTSDKDLMVLKLERKWIGAAVSIVDEQGREISSQILPKRKMIIDFSPLAEGEYRIIFSKGGSRKELVYERK